MNVYEAVMKRRSIRRFQDKAVPYETLEKCVNAARLAPSARNSQVCEYIVVDDTELLPQVFTAIKSWAGTLPSDVPVKYHPKAFIITLINSTVEKELGGSRRDTTIDVGLAAENILLVALEEGLGTCTLMSFAARELKPALNIPDQYEVVLAIALGYPDENPVVETATDNVKRWADSQGVSHVPKRKLEDILHRNNLP